MKKNIAVVGCGHWGKNLVRNFAELGVLGAVCDPNTKLAEMYANQHEVNSLTVSSPNLSHHCSPIFFILSRFGSLL